MAAERGSKKSKADAEKRLQAPPMPAAALHVWEWFAELSGRRVPAGLGGTPALLFSEIEAWQCVRRIRLRGWELDAILELDDLFPTVMTPRAQPPAPEPAPVGRPRR